MNVGEMRWHMVRSSSDRERRQANVRMKKHLFHIYKNSCSVASKAKENAMENSPPVSSDSASDAGDKQTLEIKKTYIIICLSPASLKEVAPILLPRLYLPLMFSPSVLILHVGISTTAD